MALKSIDAVMIQKMFLSGAKALEAKKEYINELNVFPVPDGDTGTNMTMTIMSAAKEVTNLEKPSMDELGKAISSRSEERRVGKECASMCRSRWSPYH